MNDVTEGEPEGPVLILSEIEKYIYDAINTSLSNTYVKVYITCSDRENPRLMVSCHCLYHSSIRVKLQCRHAFGFCIERDKKQTTSKVGTCEIDRFIKKFSTCFETLGSIRVSNRWSNAILLDSLPEHMEHEAKERPIFEAYSVQKRS